MKWDDTIRSGEGQDTTSIPFLCPVCGKKLKVDADVNAYEVSCPGCGSLIMTPVVGIGPGTRLDDFVLKRRVGRGAMGDVYLAEQRSLFRPVAVKILAPAWSSNPEMLARFRYEVKILARLEHPNIVTAFSAGYSRGVHYLAMQYVKGGTLHEMVQHHGPMSEIEALSAAYKVAEALRYAWREHGLIHRDIKPANIMVDTDGEIQVTDLGISKCIYEDESATHGHRVFGTPYFMSPEQARGRLDLDFRSDQYSLGATLYFLLTGGPAFETMDVDKAIRLQGTSVPPPIASRRAGLTHACIRCVEKMMAMDPARRYDSWIDVMNALGAIIDDHPTREIRFEPEPAAAPSAPGQEHRGRRIVGALAVISLLVLAGLRLWDRHQAGKPTVSTLITGDMSEAGGVIREQYSKVQDAVTAYIDDREAEKAAAKRIAEILDELDMQAAVFQLQGRMDDAVAVYRDYDGPMEQETRPERRTRIAELSLPDD